MENPLTKHCHAVGETYPRHLRFAVGCGMKMISGGPVCIVHGLFPFAFARTGSRTASALHEQFNTGARRPATPSPPSH